jgi:Flp pilus assembly pilin Flp
MYLQRSSPWQDEGGQGLTGYTLILVLVAIAVVAVMTLFGETLKETYCGIVGELSFVAQTSSACKRPIIRPALLDRGPNYINLEAEINDPDGDPGDPYGAIAKVEFYIDSSSGSPVTTEYHYKYCLGDGDNPCQNYDISSLSPGEHTVIIMAYDLDGNVGTAQYGFTR